MNHLSRQGIIALLAAAVTTTSIAERSSSSQCTDGGNYSNEVPLPGSLGYCPGIDVVNGFTRPFQYQDDFPGNFPFPTEPRGNSLRVPQIYSSNGFWVEGKKTETLTCFKSKGYNLNVDVSEDGSQTVTFRGHAVFAAAEEPDFKIIFSGLNTPNVTPPFLYYMKGGESSYTLSSSNETGTVITTLDFIKITGDFVDICAELEAALNGGGGGEEDNCAGKDEAGCNNDDNYNCMWKRKKSECIPKPMPWN